ncbi:MAG: B12-binding domain-containing protein [Rhodomicrobiaceae bacterium]
MLDEICLDRRYVEGGQVIPKAEQRIDEKLESIIDAEIIPRLMLMHRESEGAADEAPKGLANEELAAHVAEFANLVLKFDVDVLAAYISVLRQRGVDTERLLLKLFAPAARKLGEMWEADAIDFVDVTVGTSRLQQLLHQFSLPAKADATLPARRVLLLPTPSEQHTFGLLMVGDFFRRYGWEVSGGTPISTERLPSVVADQWFALVGFSLSCERLIGLLGSTIKTVRRHSRNRAVQIVVGGQVFVENKDLGHALGADLAVADAREAVELAENVLRDS